MAAVSKVLNIAAILGWNVVLGSCLFSKVALDSKVLWRIVLALESICCFEVVQMLIGSIRGNVTLGVVLHYTRLFLLVGVLPRISALAKANNWIVTAIYVSWSVTEVFRYGHYLARREVMSCVCARAWWTTCYVPPPRVSISKMVAE